MVAPAGASVEAEGQDVGRQVTIGRRRGERQQTAFVDNPIADRRQYRSLVHFSDGNVERFKVIQIRCSIIGDPHGHRVHTGTIRLTRRPAEQTGSWIDRRSGRHAPASRLKDRVLAGRSPSVAAAVNVSKLPSLTFLLPIAASTGAWFTSPTVMLKVSKSFQTRCCIISDPHGHRVHTGTIRLTRRPAEQTGSWIDRGPGRPWRRG